METTTYIIISDNKAQPNWTGNKFGNTPALIYQSPNSVIATLKEWFTEQSEAKDKRSITIISLTNEQMAEKIKAKEAIF